jgi:hypothetical protein
MEKQNAVWRTVWTQLGYAPTRSHAHTCYHLPFLPHVVPVLHTTHSYPCHSFDLARFFCLQQNCVEICWQAFQFMRLHSSNPFDVLMLMHLKVYICLMQFLLTLSLSAFQWPLCRLIYLTLLRSWCRSEASSGRRGPAGGLSVFFLRFHPMAKAEPSFLNVVIYNMDNGRSPKEQFYTHCPFGSAGRT